MKNSQRKLTRSLRHEQKRPFWPKYRYGSIAWFSPGNPVGYFFIKSMLWGGNKHKQSFVLMHEKFSTQTYKVITSRAKTAKMAVLAKIQRWEHCLYRCAIWYKKRTMRRDSFSTRRYSFTIDAKYHPKITESLKHNPVCNWSLEFQFIHSFIHSSIHLETKSFQTRKKERQTTFFPPFPHPNFPLWPVDLMTHYLSLFVVNLEDWKVLNDISKKHKVLAPHFFELGHPIFEDFCSKKKTHLVNPVFVYTFQEQKNDKFEHPIFFHFPASKQHLNIFLHFPASKQHFGTLFFALFTNKMMFWHHIFAFSGSKATF